MSRAGPIAALIGGALLTVVIALELVGGFHEDRQMPRIEARPSPGRAGSGSASRVTPTDTRVDLESILARPLFAPTRRPAPAVAEGGIGQTLPRVSGILIDGQTRRVIFAAAEGGRPFVAGEGSRIGAFTIQSIADGTVTVIGPDSRRVLRPSFDPRPPEPQPARPAAGSAEPVTITAAPSDQAGGPPIPIPGLPGFTLRPPPGGLSGIPGLVVPTVPPPLGSGPSR